MAIPLKAAAVRGKSGAESPKSQLQRVRVRGGGWGGGWEDWTQKSLTWRSSRHDLIVMRLHSEEATAET